MGLRGYVFVEARILVGKPTVSFIAGIFAFCGLCYSEEEMVLAKFSHILFC